MQVTGTVRQYVVADIESEFGLTLDPNIEYEEQEPAVVAQSVAVTPRTSPDTTDTTAADTAGMALDLGGEMQDVEGEGKPVTDVGALLGASDLQAYLDRPVDLSSVDVQQVLSDSTFWIGPSESERLFVFLNEHVTPDTPTEGRYDITAGQTISLEGSVRSLPSMEQVRERLNLDEQAASALETKQFYVWAQKASIEEQQGEGSA